MLSPDFKFVSCVYFSVFPAHFVRKRTCVIHPSRTQCGGQHRALRPRHRFTRLAAKAVGKRGRQARQCHRPEGIGQGIAQREPLRRKPSATRSSGCRRLITSAPTTGGWACSTWRRNIITGHGCLARNAPIPRSPPGKTVWCRSTD